MCYLRVFGQGLCILYMMRSLTLELFWFQCSVSCGHGVSVRNVQCRSTDGQILRGGTCDPSSRPYDTRKCYMGPCPLMPPRVAAAFDVKKTTTTTTSTTPTTTTERLTTTTTTAANHNTVRWRISDWSQASFCLKLHLGEVQKFFAHIRAQAICLMHELDKMNNHKMCKLASGLVRFKEILRD